MKYLILGVLSLVVNFSVLTAEAKTVIHTADLGNGGTGVYYDDGSYELLVNDDAGQTIDYQADINTTGGYDIEAVVEKDDTVTNVTSQTNGVTGTIETQVEVKKDGVVTSNTNSVVTGTENSFIDVEKLRAQTDTNARINGKIDLSNGGSVTLDASDGLSIKAQYNSGSINGQTKSFIVSLSGDTEVLIADNDDVTLYNQLVIEERPVVKKITTEGNEVRVSYNQPARLFGFIPRTVSADIVVSADGEVNIAMPWYSFLYTKKSKDVKVAVENNLAIAKSAGFNTYEITSGDVAISSRAKANLVNYTTFIADEVIEGGNVVVKSVVSPISGKVISKTNIDAIPTNSNVQLDAVLNGNTFDVNGTKNADGSIDLIQNINGSDINFKAIPDTNGTYNVRANYNGYVENYSNVNLNR